MKLSTLYCNALLLIATAACATLAFGASVTEGPRNVILIIGDGMDEQQLTIARNYYASGPLQLDTLAGLAAVRIQTIADKSSAQERDKKLYVADSANTATSIATGVVTSPGRIAIDASGQTSLPTILQQAKEAGYRTGLVSTASITDATPAAFASHSIHRGCQGPSALKKSKRWFTQKIDCRKQAKINGGAGSIAGQLLANGVDVLLGGGRKYFEQQGFGGEEKAKDSAGELGYEIVHSSVELAESQGTRLLGLFANENLPVRLDGEDERRAEAIVLDAEKRNLAAEAFSCIKNRDFGDTPTLQAMTDKAIAVLSKNSSKGFFLMVESASIDKQSHARNPCGHIGEVKQLDEAVTTAMAFARKHPDTLILVTADHSHAAQIIPDPVTYKIGEQAFHTPGLLARVKTQGNSVMAINYGTSNFIVESHTGSTVPLYSNLPRSVELPTYLNQSEIYRVMMKYLNL